MSRILNHVTVARDGMHNAFTDLQYWQDCYWVSYRKGTGHVSMDGAVVLAVSADRERWREIACRHVRGDNRDPKLLPLEEDRMALYFPSWTCGAARRELQQYISFSSNGYDWEPPRPILEPRQWLWRIRRHAGRYYGLIQNLSGSWDNPTPPHQLDLAVSDDLLDWEMLARVGPEAGLCESDIHWREDGEAWIVARSVVRQQGSFFCTAYPPYREWQITGMTPMVHAPIMLEHGGGLYVAGRSLPASEGIATFPFTGSSMGIWRVQRGHLEPVLRLPAGGDCSYPGMIRDPEGRICLSYYSQHAYLMGVLQPPAGSRTESRLNVNDVYFTELDLE